MSSKLLLSGVCLRSLIAGATLTSMSGLIIAPAQAQTTATPTATADSDSPQGVEDIVITAQRRSENLQDVPVAVTALTSATIADRRIVNTRDIEKAVAGLELAGSQNEVTPVLRGIGNEFAGQGQELPVAVYIDGVYQVTPIGNMFSTGDLQQIEVLKGPQGTLFGRNATGGVIQLTTRDPKTEPSMDASIGYGNFNTLDLKLYATGGLTDTLSASITAGYHDQMDGWGRNLLTGADTYKNRELDLKTKWKLDLGATAFTLWGGYTKITDTTNVGAYLLGIQLDGMRGPANIFDMRNDYPNFSRIEKGDVNLRISHDFGAVSLVSISSWQKVKGYDSLDQDGTPLPIINFDTHEKTESQTQELQLVSRKDSRLSWILGGFYMRSVAQYNPITITGLGLQGLPFEKIDNRLVTKSLAGFGQATFELTKGTRLTAGLRYTDDRQSQRGSLNFGGLVIPGSGSASFSKLSWRFALDQRFSPDILGYISYNRGFKSGVFNGNAPGTPVVRPEILDAYQAGLKTELFDHKLRLNVEAFWYEYKDIQILQIVVGGTTFSNAAAARIKGFDLDFEASPVRDFSIQGSLAYNDANYTSYPNATCSRPTGFGGNTPYTCDATGLPIGEAAPWSASVAPRYEVGLGSGGKLALGASYYFRSSYLAGIDRRIRVDEQNVVGAFVTWTSPDQRWDVRLWADNLFDARYLRSGQSGPLGDGGEVAPPRTFGITIGTHLGKR